MLLALAALTSRAAAQPAWTVEYGRERADVSTFDVDSTWTVDRVQAVRSEPGEGGWLVLAERQERYGEQDVAFLARAYRHAGRWTFSAAGGGSPNADFLYHARGGGEISYRAIGGLVASGAYEFLRFPSADIHQVQPAMTFYHARGEIEGRVYVTRNIARARTTAAALLRAGHDFTRRLRLGGGVAVGDRIFDVASLATDAGDARFAFVDGRVGLTERDFITAVVSAATEKPGFTYRAVTFGYRRVF